ncbi:MAG: hypothetical protein CO032_02770 [Nitrosopumilales archaeon CG_4_9_14_0_2_um_filter_34_16]|nr:MAG: hypothetical protein CO032_02770 [Nitrosopumilales archaeon CG_4_9_14_0_2_um_filter_34_16]
MSQGKDEKKDKKNDTKQTTQNDSSPRALLKENHTIVIAIMVIAPFMFFFGWVLLVYKDAVLLEKMTALLSGIVAGVLGYYFGQRPTQQLSEQVKKVQSESDDHRHDAAEAANDFLALAEQFENFKRQFDEIKKLGEEENE